MANARIGGFTLDVDPSSASWGYTLNTRTYDTYGGRVVQILSCSVDSLVIGGYLLQRTGPGAGTYDRRFENMRAFAEKVKNIMLYHADAKRPVEFYYPALDWRGQVYLRNYSDVKYDVASCVCSYRLTFDIESGFDSIKTAVSSQGLELIPDGINWVRNKYNTPTGTTWESVKKGLEKILNEAGTSADVMTLGEAIEAASEEGKKKGDGSSTPQRATSSNTPSDFFNRHFGLRTNQLIR